MMNFQLSVYNINLRKNNNQHTSKQQLNQTKQLSQKVLSMISSFANILIKSLIH